jgi:hypothetical protein
MKTPVIVLLLLLGTPVGMFFGAWCGASGTNRDAYLPQGGISDETGEEALYYQFRCDVGELPPEVLPSTEDRDGHWGLVTNGLQLSLRFRRSEYQIGEPVRAVMILRNLDSTNHALWIPAASGARWAFTVRYGTNREITIRPKVKSEYDNGTPPPGSPLVLEPLTEWWGTVDFSSVLDLTKAGQYSVQAICPEWVSSNEKSRGEAVSGIAQITISEKLSASGQEQKDAWQREMTDLFRRAKARREKAERIARSRLPLPTPVVSTSLPAAPFSLSISIPPSKSGDHELDPWRTPHFYVILSNTSRVPENVWAPWSEANDHTLTFQFTDASGKTWMEGPNEPDRFSNKLAEVSMLRPGESLVFEVDYANKNSWENFPVSSSPIVMRAVYEISHDPAPEVNKVWIGKVVSEPVTVVIRPK